MEQDKCPASTHCSAQIMLLLLKPYLPASLNELDRHRLAVVPSPRQLKKAKGPSFQVTDLRPRWESRG